MSDSMDECKAKAMDCLPDFPVFALHRFLASLKRLDNDHPAITVGALMFVLGGLRTSEEVRKWIESV